MTSSSTYEVYAIRYGTRVARRAEVFLNFELYQEPDGEIGMDYYFWIARNADRTLVIDIGYDPVVGERRGRKLLIDPIEALQRLGIAAVDVAQLVVTHAHYDHIGNLRRLPNAEVVIARSEFDFWTGPFGTRTQFASSAEAAEIAHLAAVRDQGRAVFFSGDHSVAPGIEIIEVGGHTPGQSMVTVNTQAGQVVLASDAIHYYEEYEQDRPFTFVADLRAMYQGFDTVRDMLADPGRSLVPGHDPAVPERFAGLGADLDGMAVRVG
jgi:glyoxylase-like metal-dependent hydrolase (beta-lactamase superfamily II)